MLSVTEIDAILGIVFAQLEKGIIENGIHQAD